ncbi:MAG TPA: glycosyltransferase [Candidatus Paceibacterota bacterium]|nr:hypothetical protein [Verrucomicrobiota bacterium]HOX02388.1 glycosyltransferase [Verrucomicrobiota bacterium]HRZ45142.1 glycosyltransferase [Candidatus Paceibacterota bacterium]HRZ92970.1 glycosyltransferase [Candidatus Paceibacterota bacterium]
MKVLLAAVSAGAGHLQAAAALEEAWRERQPADDIERLDVLDLAPRFFRKAYADAYVRLVTRAPELWGLMFDRTDRPALLQRLTRWRRLAARHVHARLVRHLRSWRPDAVLCTHFLPLEVLGYLKQRSRSGWRPWTACVITDFEAHALWIESGVDLYCVAAEETRWRLLARGVPPESIAVTGIPISASFARHIPTGRARRDLGLPAGLPLVLVLGGGLGMGPVGAVMRELGRAGQPFQAAVVCGRNDRLRRQLEAEAYPYPVRVLGFVGNMHEWMSAARLIVTKPGGLTSSEALAVGRPMLLLEPIPGQEAANSDFLLEHGAAVKVNRVEDLSFRIEPLLGSARLAAMARAARRIGRPRAALAVCEAASQRLEYR